jgi:hypothetical protein
VEPENNKTRALASYLYLNQADCRTDSDNDEADSNNNEAGNEDNNGNHNDHGGE